MFLALWNYLKGYVIIKVSGFSTERFINMASYRGIYIWDMKTYDGYIYIKVSLSGFKFLKECARKTGCKFEIVNRCGLPFFVYRYRKRKLLALGIPAFVIFIYILSSFLWKIDVVGNDRVLDTSIIEMLEKEGIKAGTLKFKVDTKDIAKKLIEEFPDISWASVSLKGTDMIIKISETIKKTDMEDNTPSDIVATKDGIIESVAVSSGTPLVSQGDVIYKGDVLVSGEIILKDGEEEVGRQLTSAKAKVFAKIWYEFYNEVPLFYTENIYTGNEKDDTYFKFKDIIINILSPNILYENFDKTVVYENKLSIGDYDLPISIIKEKYMEYEVVDKERTEDEAKSIIEYKIEENIMDNIPEGDIVQKDTEYIVKDNKVYAKTTVAVIERIDERRLRSE